ncbi:tautomerase family protein [Agrobacterium rosae]|uniref:tautomerase family protein n=1 Tax=Agrobacterium rosae TaxID=1972867 RepID=UPI001FCCCFEA|nr:tautomerase family protein [Agrobacterium rosae]
MKGYEPAIPFNEYGSYCFVYIWRTVLRPGSQEEKLAFYENLCRDLDDRCGIQSSDVMISFTQNTDRIGPSARGRRSLAAVIFDPTHTNRVHPTDGPVRPVGNDRKALLADGLQGGQIARPSIASDIRRLLNLRALIGGSQIADNKNRKSSASIHALPFT